MDKFRVATLIDGFLYKKWAKFEAETWSRSKGGIQISQDGMQCCLKRQSGW